MGCGPCSAPRPVSRLLGRVAVGSPAAGYFNATEWTASPTRRSRLEDSRQILLESSRIVFCDLDAGNMRESGLARQTPWVWGSHTTRYGTVGNNKIKCASDPSRHSPVTGSLLISFAVMSPLPTPPIRPFPAGLTLSSSIMEEREDEDHAQQVTEVHEAMPEKQERTKRSRHPICSYKWAIVTHINKIGRSGPRDVRCRSIKRNIGFIRNISKIRTKEYKRLRQRLAAFSSPVVL